MGVSVCEVSFDTPDARRYMQARRLLQERLLLDRRSGAFNKSNLFVVDAQEGVLIQYSPNEFPELDYEKPGLLGNLLLVKNYTIISSRSR